MIKKKEKTNEDKYYELVKILYNNISIIVSEELKKGFENILNSGIEFDEHRKKSIEERIKYCKKDIKFYKNKL